MIINNRIYLRGNNNISRIFRQNYFTDSKIVGLKKSMSDKEYHRKMSISIKLDNIMTRLKLKNYRAYIVNRRLK